MSFSPRFGFVLGFVVCAALLGFGYYLQYVEMQEPCPLCMLQRFAYMAVGVICLIGVIHGPARTGTMVYSALVFMCAALGAAVAARQVWLQHLPKHLVPECGPGFDYMIRKFPLGDALARIFRGSGECAETGWTFLGLSIAGWSLLWLVTLCALAIVIGLRARAQPRA